MKIAVIDFETADTGADSACALGLIVLEQGKIVSEASYLIRPPRRQFLFTDIHGLTWNDVSESPTFAELLPEIHRDLSGSQYIPAHNGPLVISLLQPTHYVP